MDFHLPISQPPLMDEDEDFYYFYMLEPQDTIKEIKYHKLTKNITSQFMGQGATYYPIHYKISSNISSNYFLNKEYN